jgi:hypothetical protein
MAMTTLNITYNGMSADVPVELDGHVSDADVRRIALEMVRSGGVPGMHLAHLRDETFQNYVVDRFRGHHGEDRIYLRPKVPFGSCASVWPTLGS